MLGNSASAKIREGRLILSMPDAETPVVWILDMNDATTSVLRLESDKQGFYVIKKHSGKTSETVAVYRNRKPAVRALNKATRALDRARGTRGTGGRSRFINTLIVILFIWFALSRFWSIDQDLIRWAIFPLIKDQLIAAAQQQAGATQTPGPQVQPQASGAPSNPDAVGVPVPADDALKAQADKANNLMLQ